MNSSTEKLLADARLLVGRLKDHDAVADDLTKRTSSLQHDIEARNAYLESLKVLNKAAGNKPRSTLILGIQQENCAIRLLQKENQEMRESLVDYQTALELIMNKYRQQKVEFMNDKNTSPVVPSKSNLDVGGFMNTQALNEKISEMAVVMQKAIDVDDNGHETQLDYISLLEEQNQQLRDLLLIPRGHYRAVVDTEKGNSDCPDTSAPEHTLPNSDENAISHDIDQYYQMDG